VIVLLMLLPGRSRSLFDASIVFKGVKARKFRQHQRSLSWLGPIARAPRADPALLGAVIESHSGFKDAITNSSRSQSSQVKSNQIKSSRVRHGRVGPTSSSEILFTKILS
jgi:hypothetical protein